MAKKRMEQDLEALDAVVALPLEARIEPLRAALRHRNNFVVARAAKLVEQAPLPALIPELLTAYDRFFADPVKTDPQCWAKNALVHALAALDHQEAEPYLRGVVHRQFEPVWGGQSDTASTLRSHCLFALIPCRELSEPTLLRHFITALADPIPTVRASAARAIAQLESSSASLLLRLRAEVAGLAAEKEEAEALGACYSGVLAIEGHSAIAWVAKFLVREDDAAAEAALALAGTRAPEAVSPLRAAFARVGDPWFASVLLSALALTRQPEAAQFLLAQIEAESYYAEQAVEALLRASPAPELLEQLTRLVQGNTRLQRVLDRERG
ncbi:HEAT repeat domain-containing protein [Silvibacterium sp.]|uniref:HEAT repeat domain-containing protein n=1 Tax=Silvibacterium sp. TaxID=1964179 RepID=UPI0039E3A99E